MAQFMFPRIYSSYVARFNEDLIFWQKMASISRGPILELGCGPGRVLRDLSVNGYQVTGLDTDPEMLNWSRTHLLSHLYEQVILIEADMRRFKLEQSFPLIIVPCNTFAYFNDQDAHQVLSCIRQHLTKQGQAILVVPNPEVSLTTQQARTESENLQDNPILNFIEPISGNPI